MYQENRMKTFKEHLNESKRSYAFKVKIAGNFSAEQETSLRTLLDRYKVEEFKKLGKTPVQELPLDFPQLRNSEVTIFEVVVDYPVASYELQNYLSGGLKISEQSLIVRKPGEPSEQYQEPQEKRKGALLNDSDYKESPNVDSNDYYGDKYNASLIKTLNDDLKAQRAIQGEKIPGKIDTTNEVTHNNKSPVGSK